MSFGLTALTAGKFKRQVLLEGYVADFVCHEASLFVEVDGPLHRKPKQQVHDTKRDTVLRHKGFHILRFDDEAALGRIGEEIRQALLKTPLPTPD